MQKAGWARVSQDDLGDRYKCERKTAELLLASQDVVIDRCNFDAAQRAHWVGTCSSRNAEYGALGRKRDGATNHGRSVRESARLYDRMRGFRDADGRVRRTRYEPRGTPDDPAGKAERARCAAHRERLFVPGPRGDV